MDIDIAFIKKFYTEFTVTIFAVKNDVTRENIEYGRRHIWSPGITINDYILLLKIWKVVKLLGKEKSYIVFNTNLKSISGIPDDMNMIIRKIADMWYKQRTVVYAMPKTIDDFKTHKITLAHYLGDFLARTNHYRPHKES
ncbi:MAG: hypothetical protein E7022_00355 [Desulfovibrio desulfuricans]|nr:hypothetical protein [Desulfovibrio desulfuricans]